MRKAVCLIVLLLASGVLAGDRQWKDAKVTRIAASTENSGVVAETTGTTTVGGGVVKNTSMYYWIETEDMIYILDYSNNPAVKMPWPGQHSRGRSPNLTLNGKTKISIEGHNAHILDDDGRDVKLPIFEKIARTPSDTK